MHNDAEGSQVVYLRSRTQSKIRFTMSGGFFRALREAMSLGVMLFSAARADSKAGLAASKSFSALSFTPAISCADMTFAGSILGL